MYIRLDANISVPIPKFSATDVSVFVSLLQVKYLVIQTTLLVFRWELVILLQQLVFIFCFERDFIASLLYDTQNKNGKAFSSTSGYLDVLLIIENPLKAW